MQRSTFVLAAAVLTAAAIMGHAAALRAAPVADSTAITPPDSLPLFPHPLNVAPQFARTFPAAHTLNLPAGFEVNVFADGLPGARFMCWSPDSVLYVCAMAAGNVFALPDNDHDGIADRRDTIVTGLTTAHSLQFYKDTLYVAETGDVLKLVDTTGDRRIDKRSVFISGLLTGGNHVTRTLVFDAAAHKVYVAVGSTCNICDDPPERACILQFNDDGTGKRVFASGLRNSVGLAFHPVTHELWASNNGFDNAGNDIPPEVVNVIHDGDFYGWPFAYGAARFNPIYQSTTHHAMSHDDSLRVLGMAPPAVQMQAHSAPLGMEFYSGHELPSSYDNSAFVCFHGSWNRSPSTGYKVVRIRDVSSTNANDMRIADFMSGFMTDSTSSDPSTGKWGRPVGVVFDHRGSMYISDDKNGAIYRVHYTPPTGVHEGALPAAMPRITRVFPDPAAASCTVEFTGTEWESRDVVIVDEHGATVARTNAARRTSTPGTVSFDTSNLPAGAYRIWIVGTEEHAPLVIQR